MTESQQITELLTAWNEGDETALEQLMPVVETELRRIAHSFMRRENQNHTLQTTALVNEAFLKLVDQRGVNWQNRAQFFALLSQFMRRTLINYARDRNRIKRGGEYEKVSLENSDVVSPEKSKELIALDKALDKLAKFDQLKSKIVEMRYFGGLSIDETSEILKVAPATVSRHWRLAKAWLGNEIKNSF